MAARNDLLAKIIEAIKSDMKGGIFAGRLPQRAFEELSSLNPKFTEPNTVISNHGIFSRFDKDGWSPERIYDSYKNLIGSDETRGIPNLGGGNRVAKEALWLPDYPVSILAPTIPTPRGGANIVTMYEPETKKVLSHLDSIGWPSGERPSSISGLHGALSAGVPSSQQRRLSAVEGQPKLEDILGSIFDQVKNRKNILPWLAGGAAASSTFGADDAQAAPRVHADADSLDRTIERLSKAMPLNDMASGMIPRATQARVQPINNMAAWHQMEQLGYVTPDLPVPEAEWSPVDLATAPIGAAGKMGKFAAMALDAPINFAVNRLFDALSAGANTASNWWNGK